MPDNVVIHSNLHTGEYFFSTSHIQGVKAKETYPEGFVPTTHYLPHSVVARPALPTGWVTNLKELLTIYYYDAKEIPNPDPSYQPGT